ncbi:hypothetical protein DFH08DRAFT_799598 [Mycena albidolilacea]|uniref:DUF3533 domain-containing protein n=1 Tax=Mycena albidolilacea TaxID=1033008 RepID=A0AAD7AMJ1_9AGAR|nr:hypothetical protein DFH08DRAFT_799598 [Mycena albidolilacea]
MVRVLMDKPGYSPHTHASGEILQRPSVVGREGVRGVQAAAIQFGGRSALMGRILLSRKRSVRTDESHMCGEKTGETSTSWKAMIDRPQIEGTVHTAPPFAWEDDKPAVDRAAHAVARPNLPAPHKATVVENLNSSVADEIKRDGYGSFGMLSCGLALDAMITLITLPFLPIFLFLWIFSNVAVRNFSIPVLPSMFRYGYVFPAYNISRAVRTLVFRTKNDLALNFGILL